MQTLTKRTQLGRHCVLQTLSIRKCSNTSKIIKPRRRSNIEDNNDGNKSKTPNPSKIYKSGKESWRSINVYNKISNLKTNELEDMITAQETAPFKHLNNNKLSKKMKKKLKKQVISKPDFSANFLQENKNSAYNDNSIHGIIQMFDDQQQQQQQPMIDDDEYWYNNPEHIEQIEEFLTKQKLPFNPDPFNQITSTNNNDELKTSYLTDDITERDKIRINKQKLTKRMQLRLNRKLKTKRRGNDVENMNKNELIQRNTVYNNDIINNNKYKTDICIKNENVDISLKVWDPIKKEFTHSPTPQHPSTKTGESRSKNKLANKWKKYEENVENMDITDLNIANISPYWLHLNNVDPVIMDQLSRRLPISSRHFSETPQGLYCMNDEIRKHLQKILVSEYWPSGWAEKKEEQIFGQRLFNAVSVKYDRRKVLRYIANEFPLSLAVNYRVLKELKHRMPDFKPKGMIDFGAGPGCSTLAAMEIFNDSLKTVYGIEPSVIMREFGMKILEDYKEKYHLGYLDDLNNIKLSQQQPLIICSFVLSEIGGGIDKLCQYLDNLWLSTRKILIFIEAGTIDGYNLINFARSYLLSKYPPSNSTEIPGTYTIAPCPHDKQCPLSSNHICRFIQRIDRHQVPSRCMFKSDRKRTKYINQKNKLKGKHVKIKDKRRINEVQFPYSYCILGKGVSPRLISPQSNIFSHHFPHYFMNHKQSEQAAYFWPRVISPPKYRHNNLYLHLCLPDIPSHANYNNNIQSKTKIETETETKTDGNNNHLMRLFDDKIEEFQSHLIPNGRVCGTLKLDNRKSAKPHTNISDTEGIDEMEYGYLEKWLISRSDNKLQQYQDARRCKWGDLWPWPSPIITRSPSLQLNESTKHSFVALTRYSRPRFRDNFAKFRKDCGKFVYHSNNIDLISNDLINDQQNQSV